MKTISAQEAWTSAFVDELILRLRPYVSAQLARDYAGREWPKRQHQGGADAARDFHANRSPPPRQPSPGSVN
jgi:hypothetical protein